MTAFIKQNLYAIYFRFKGLYAFILTFYKGLLQLLYVSVDIENFRYFSIIYEKDKNYERGFKKWKRTKD